MGIHCFTETSRRTKGCLWNHHPVCTDRHAGAPPCRNMVHHVESLMSGAVWLWEPNKHPSEPSLCRWQVLLPPDPSHFHDYSIPLCSWFVTNSRSVTMLYTALCLTHLVFINDESRMEAFSSFHSDHVFWPSNIWQTIMDKCNPCH